MRSAPLLFLTLSVCRVGGGGKEIVEHTALVDSRQYSPANTENLHHYCDAPACLSGKTAGNDAGLIFGGVYDEREEVLPSFCRVVAVGTVTV